MAIHEWKARFLSKVLVIVAVINAVTLWVIVHGR